MKYLLAFFFLMMYSGDQLSLNVSLGPGLSTKNLLLYLVFAWIAVNASVTRNRSLDLVPLLVTFALLILYAVVTWIAAAFVVDNPDYELRSTFIALKSSLVDQYLTFIIFLFGITKAKEAIWLLKAILWITVVGNVITLVDTFNIPNLGILQNPGRKAGRFDGFIGQPNSYGQILVLFLAPTVALYLNSIGRAKLLAAVGVFAAAMALVLTGSRGSWLGFLVGAAFGAYYMRDVLSGRTIWKVATSGVLACAAIVVIAFLTGYADIFLSSLEKFEGGANRATSGRATIWKTAVLAILDQPLSIISGHGFEAYAHSREFRMAAHNIYLTYLYDLGVIGLALFCSVFWQIITTAKSVTSVMDVRNRRYMVAVAFGLTAFLVSIFFSEYHTSAYLLWAYLGVSMRVGVMAREGELNAGATASKEALIGTDNERLHLTD